MPYVIRKEIVARSLKRLREQKTHTLFAGYLHLQQRSAELERLNDLQPDFLPFFKNFFLVEDHPLGSPYIKIFTEQKPSEANLWLNSNVAGSYAPSSLRPEQPFRKVVEISSDGARTRTYSLSQGHAKLALEHLLFKQRVLVAELAVVLYRDYGFLDANMRIRDLIFLFAYEFGYWDGARPAPFDDFNTLYEIETMHSWEKEWLESL